MTRLTLQAPRCRSRRGGDRCDRPEHPGDLQHRCETPDGAGHPIIHVWVDRA
jgi:hypothetical protein